MGRCREIYTSASRTWRLWRLCRSSGAFFFAPPWPEGKKMPVRVRGRVRDSVRVRVRVRVIGLGLGFGF